MKNFLSLTIATWFGAGLIPPPRFLHGMAGTYGSIAALPLCAWLVYRTNLIHQQIPYDINAWFIYGFWVVLLAMISFVAINRAERALGPRTDWKGKTKTRDQNQIVADEVIGMLVTCFPLTMMTPPNWWVAYLLALIYFRIFDIIKIWPARVFDRMHDPFGIIMDDVIAGLYAAICLVLTYQIF